MEIGVNPKERRSQGKENPPRADHNREDWGGGRKVRMNNNHTWRVQRRADAETTVLYSAFIAIIMSM